MNIVYLKNLYQLYVDQDWLKYGGVPQKEIKSLELRIGFTLPIAYKEFLLIDGQDCPIMKVGYRFKNVEEINRQAHDYFKEYDVGLDRDIWVVGESSGSMYISFFYLDEGDNPPIYRFDFHHFENIAMYKEEMIEHGELIEADEIDEENEYLMKIYDSYSDYIDAKIDM